MDNKIFNINGRTKNQLALALELLFLNEYDNQNTTSGWYFSEEKGLVLTWMVKNDYKAIPFTDRMGKPCSVNHEELVDILWDWLSTDEAKSVKLFDWDRDADHDGTNNLGWRLYTEDWGQVDGDFYSIVAFKPAYLWYGK